MRRATQNGFTIVELLIVVVVIAILAAIALVSFTGIQDKARTSRSLSTVDQVRAKASAWNALMSNYPDLAQLRTNSVSPPNIDTPGGVAGPVEAKLSSPAVAMGATIDIDRADGGNTVFYAPCPDGARLTGARIIYWDYSLKGPVTVTTGNCP